MSVIINNNTVALGDTLRSLTGTIALVQHFQSQGEDVYVKFHNEDVGTLFSYDKYNTKPPTDGLADVQNIHISWHDQTRGASPLRSDVDFNQAISEYYKIDVARLKDYGEGSGQITVPFDQFVPTFDFVIAPYVLNNAYKNMSPQFWQKLVDALMARGSSVAVIGKLTMPSDADLQKIEADIGRFKGADYIKYNFTKYLTGPYYFTDQPIIKVANLINKMNFCMISPDSGPSHLINKLEKPHIEFHPHQNVMISKFSGYNDRTELGRSITIEDVLIRVQRMFQGDK